MLVAERRKTMLMKYHKLKGRKRKRWMGRERQKEDRGGRKRGREGWGEEGKRGNRMQRRVDWLESKLWEKTKDQKVPRSGSSGKKISHKIGDSGFLF